MKKTLEPLPKNWGQQCISLWTPSCGGSYYGMGSVCPSSVCCLSVACAPVNLYLVSLETCEIIDQASPNSVVGFYPKISDEFVFGSPWSNYKVAEVNTACERDNLWNIWHNINYFGTCTFHGKVLDEFVFGSPWRIPRSLRSTSCISLLAFTLWTR